MDAGEVLKKYFGYGSFKPGQQEIVEALLDGNDVLAVMPTGSGKSICYQVPAMLLTGITIVISPLISLMQDQVKALNEAGINAGYINSSLTEAQIRLVYSRASDGAYKILYVAPERLESFDFLNFTDKVEISMVAVDEAHCISQWGQDFRPSYLKIVEFIERLGKRPVVSAFTATATEEVRTDISCVLKLRDPKIVVTGFDRENLYFDVEMNRKKDDYVLEFIRNHPDESGIIYCATRNNVDTLFELLAGKGIAAVRYHAGMGNEERKVSQNDFIYDRAKVIVATNAFGMGINKTDVRFVLHYNMPQSMENYYQEAGRAGRDGAAAQCILLFSAQDIMINRFLLEHKDFSDISDEDAELIRQRDVRRLHIMEGYCRTSGCLRNYILDYFGEKRSTPCQNCGNCHRDFTETDMTEAAKQVINCVYETKGRYGLVIVLGTLLGANRARLKELKTTEYRTYGALKEFSEAELRILISQMIMDGYIIQTEEKYSVLRMGNIEPLKSPDAHVLVRTIRKDETEKRTPRYGRKSTDVLTKAGYDLFEILRRERLTVAREEGMPPYIIFNDKTLIDMCIKAPRDRAAMMNVSGVGEAKYKKYGERFTEVINAFFDENPGAVTGIEDTETSEIKTERKTKKKAPKDSFYLNPEDAANFEYRDRAFLSEIRDELNRITTAENVKRLFGTDIFRMLAEKGYAEEQQIDGRDVQAPTELGKTKGITSVEKTAQSGTVYTVLVCPRAVQEEIVEHFTRG